MTYRSSGDGPPAYVLILFAILCLILPIGVVSYAQWMGWEMEPYERTSVDNVRREYEWFNRHAAALRAAKENLQNEEQSLADMRAEYEEVSDMPFDVREAYNQRVVAVNGMRSGYNNACAEYQAAWNNEFHASVAPPGVPKDCDLAVTYRPPTPAPE